MPDGVADIYGPIRHKPYYRTIFTMEIFAGSNLNFFKEKIQREFSS